MSTTDCPILACFARLRAQWHAFVSSADARLLVWQARDDEQRMVQLLLSGVATDDACGGVDCIPLTGAFAGASEHGATLARAWRACDPRLAASVQAADALAERAFAPLHMLHEAQRASDGAKVVWLAPERVVDSDAYRGWLRGLAHTAPCGARFVAVVSPCDDGWSREPASPRIVLQACALDVPGALRVLARRADDGGVGGQLRLRMLDLTEAIAAGVPALVTQRAGALTELAVAAGEASVAVGAQLMLGASRGGSGDALGALRAYVEAERLAARCEQGAPRDAADADGARVGARLRLSARLAQGSQLLALAAFARAAEVFGDSVPLAHAVGDARLVLECHRLAARCHAALARDELAWSHGLAGLALAETMAPEVRASSTLPLLGAELLDACRGAPLEDAHRQLAARLALLLGTDWRARLPSPR